MACTANRESKGKITYDSYLKISDGILVSQKPESDVPEEILFIITHQAFELWFKIIKGDLERICVFFASPETASPSPSSADHPDTMLTVVNCFDRICKIFKVIVQHFEILETMSPMTFVEFRDKLMGGSGFQSMQFREIENKLGLRDGDRVKIGDKNYKDKFESDQQDELKKSEADENTLRKVLEKWLIKHLKTHDPSDVFLSEFEKGWKKWQEENTGLTSFEDIEKEMKGRDTSFDALKSVLFVSLFRDLPFNNLPHQILTYVKDIEALVMRWRTTHVMMVHRMIGKKPGTGGSSGVDYLINTVNTPSYRTFADIYDTASYLVPMKYMNRYQDWRWQEE